MTAFKERATKPESEGYWFPFATSRLDKKKKEKAQKKLEAVSLAAAAENRTLTPAEQEAAQKDLEAAVIFDDPEPDAAEFCVRSMVPFYTLKLKARKKKYQPFLNPLSRAMERVGYYEEPTQEEMEEQRDDALDYALIGERNAGIEFTRENKLKLLNGTIRREGADRGEFDRFLARCLKLIHEMEEAEAAGTEKN